MDLINFTIKQLHNGLKKKEFSAIELARAYLDAIKEKNKALNAYLLVNEKDALKQAERIDEKIKNKEEIRILEGAPLAIKDNILVDGLKCTAGSKILANYTAPYDATAIKRLKQAGAVILGKTNLDEFAMGASTETGAFGPTKNPHNLERVAGGSSGGSAAAVASDMCVAALGSDTGGSVRQPASFCGVVGLKPTYGAVSRYGLIAMASSLDQIGPIAKTVEDVEIIFNAIKGKDEMDATSFAVDDGIAALARGLARKDKIKIGLPKEYFIKGLDPAVEKSVRGAIGQYQKMGAEVIEISLPHSEYALAVYYIIMPAEASANLARYDGVKYGLSEAGENLLGTYLKSRQHGFGDEVRRRIIIGTYVLSAGYYDAYYLKAQKVRALIKRDFTEAFEKVDVIMAPTAPTVAFKIGEKTNDPIAMYLSDIYTASVNLAGLPAISIPCGKADGLPVGLQIIGNYFEEDRIMEIAKGLESSYEIRN